MPVRLRITLLFALLVFVILGLVCAGIYYFSLTATKQTVQTRLKNRAITTARLLSQREVFNRELIQRIDSSTTLSLKNKIVQAYDSRNMPIYTYSDVPGDTIKTDEKILDEARAKGTVYFMDHEKEAVAYHYADNHTRMVIITAAQDTEGEENLATLLRILAISFVGSVAIVLVIGYFFSRGLLMPVKKIAEDVTEISAQNLARRIQTGKTKDEWYHLSSTFNELLDRLQESFDLQRRFISNASHELSTPLTSISSQLEVSLQRERDAGEYKRVMTSIHQDVQHMSKLTQALLEFAKASGNTGGLEINLVRIDEVILALVAEIAKVNPDYAININFEDLPEEEEKLLVFGNEPLLLTAIRNIVINACKYSEDRRADLKLSVKDPYVVLEVQDYGIGIPKEEISKIFQPFYRVDETRSVEGFGLGLSLVQRIIKLHKGEIDVQSEPGQGTLFIIRLPAARFLDTF